MPRLLLGPRSYSFQTFSCSRPVDPKQSQTSSTVFQEQPPEGAVQDLKNQEPAFLVGVEFGVQGLGFRV